MTTNFTFRDFFVYLLAGLTLLISFGVIFFNDIFQMIVCFFGKYEFRPIDWEVEKTINTLYVTNPEEVPAGAQILFTGKYLDGTKGALVYTH